MELFNICFKFSHHGAARATHDAWGPDSFQHELIHENLHVGATEWISLVMVCTV